MVYLLAKLLEPVVSSICFKMNEITYKVAGIEDAFDDSSSESCTVEVAFIFGYGDETVDQCLLFNQVVGAFIIVGMLQFVCLFAKKILKQTAKDNKTMKICTRMEKTFQTVDLMKMSIWSSLISLLPAFSRTVRRSSILTPTCCPISDNLEMKKSNDL